MARKRKIEIRSDEDFAAIEQELEDALEKLEATDQQVGVLLHALQPALPDSPEPGTAAPMEPQPESSEED